MQLASDGTLIASATDLVNFLECDHLTTLELGRLEGLWERPHQRTDPTVVLLQERGDAHEHAYLDRLRAEGRDVVEIPRPGRESDDLRAAEAETVEAMRRGVGAIYQATLFDGRWLGFADFLIRAERPSPAFGAWSYEVADTKLSKAVKGGAVLQVCVYSERLATLQGVTPEHVHVVTGDGTSHELRVDDYAAYYRSVKARFEATMFGAEGTARRDARTARTYPDPVDHCRVCAWFPGCMDRRRADDHLSLVAGMSRSMTERLTAAGVRTLGDLGRLPADRPVPETNPVTLERLREQARLQLTGRERHELMYELIPPSTDDRVRGLALLPEPSALDVFFDIEADPWALDDGIEYLLGRVVTDGEPDYRPLWGHDRAGEKAAFEAFIDDVVARLDRDPRMHVYHYGGYESGAIKRLMQRHATREDEVDRILRADVLVDLYTVVRQGIRASLESYSLKQIEHFYLPAREGPVTEAGFSVVTYETWLRDGDPRRLDELAAYNRDDCISTRELRGWLEARRAEGLARGWNLPRPPIADGQPSEEQLKANEETRRRVDALRGGIPADPAARNDEQQARWLLAALVDYHRREDLPQWWRWFDLQNRTLDELVEASDALAGLRYQRDVEQRGRSIVRRYSFPAQDHKFDAGDQVDDPWGRDEATAFGSTADGAGVVVMIDDLANTIDILRPPSKLGRHPTALIPPGPIFNVPLRKGIGRLADDVIERGLSADGPHRAARDLLLRLPPRLPGRAPGAPLRSEGEDLLEATLAVATSLDDGVLPIQGPPGTGKTWTGARIVLARLAARRGPIGVTAQSHRAIANFLDALAAAAVEAGRTVRILQRCDPDDGIPAVDGIGQATNDQVRNALAAGTVDVVGGTAWLFAREELTGAFDAIVVDEAGQYSLANVGAISGAARSFMLLGDPNQLPQVTQGVHPNGSAASALGHLLGGSATIEPERGIFLDTTYRLHPAVNAYISDTFYEGRLGTDPTTALQRVAALGEDPALAGAGVRWRPVVHGGNAQRSREEAAVVAQVISELLETTWTGPDGAERALQPEDLLVVAPYNAHVAAVASALERKVGQGVGRRVGTVDRFQGREGAVAIYTMSASSAEEAPRGIDFLYDRNRLNVAVSRARALAIVVASPDLLRVACRTPEQMRRVNALCRLVEVSSTDPVTNAGSG
ncbi:MAG TPA: TM0106 family RecB-like putative nuclease [Candidatus Limnocylindrales bacterium]|nr:TM0106 family RecB-like putative nuclease [Candidatus Limnocylindrales bacterium]